MEWPAKSPDMKNALYIFLLFLNVTVFAEVPENERDALVDFYQSTNGPQWTAQWDLSKPVSTWHGIRVQNGSVVSVSLFRNNLRGTLPESIVELVHLKVLNLAFNSIEGTIPKSIVRLKNLIVLRLGKNRLSGRIPENLGEMERLVVLDLFDNRLSGKLPESLGKMRRLKSLQLSCNDLGGTIPESFGNLKAMERLEMAQNKLEGAVPQSLGALDNLQMLVLAENRLSGQFPGNIMSLPKLELLQIINNDFDISELQKALSEKPTLAICDFEYLNVALVRKDFEKSLSPLRHYDRRFRI